MTSVSTFPDYFSAVSADYAKYRPHVPAAMIAWIAGLAPGRALAWDCATGSGQTASALLPHFRRVIASDASESQLAHAARHPRLHYFAGFAEHVPLASHSVDLITVSQAIHWFDAPAFYAEVHRVLRPGGVLVEWCYEQPWTGPPVDRVLKYYYNEVVGSYWPPQRRHILRGLRTLDFPFTRLSVPAFIMTDEWTLDRLRGYFETWSAARRFTEKNGRSPVTEIDFNLKAAWGPPDQPRRLFWPLHIRAGRID